ncbi:uncharacterized protein LOC129752801 [Uranotaenia lowii]|uniref:uncharacterized protein LOC129752801 n=1 Tax=Uranotaenia lowii TaxID=190385 RepID=UPI00247ACE07|nr:uncharacterized protein LOC129752801 [Uranotaenia lowii]
MDSEEHNRTSVLATGSNGTINGLPSGQQFHQLACSKASFAPHSSLLQQHQAFATQMLNQQQEFMRQQKEMFLRTMSSLSVQVPSNPEVIFDSLPYHVKEFRYDPENNIRFSAWYARYKDLFEQNASRLDSDAKVRLLLQKMGSAEHERYVNFLLPKLPKEYQFDVTVRKLGILFGSAESLISKRYRCLQTTKKSTEDYFSFFYRVNKNAVDFELNRLIEEQFKCLLFVCGMKVECDVEVRTRLLAKIEDRNDVTLEQLSEDCQRLMCLKRDTAVIEGTSGPLAVQFVERNYNRKQISKSSPKKVNSPKNIPPTSCCKCAMHYTCECPYKDHKCSDCGYNGHRGGYCLSENKSVKPYHKKQNKTYRANTGKMHEVQQKRKFVQAQLNGAK